MNIRKRSLFFALGALVAILGAFKWYKFSRDSATQGKPYIRSTKVSDIEPGKYRFIPDIYTSVAEKSYTHTLLFLRKHDGSVQGLYLPWRNQIPAVPAADGITPLDLCTPFEISEDPEQIECVVDDVKNRIRIVHHWSWSGQAIGPVTPDLRQIVGSERNGDFVFSDPWQPDREK
jgi:hypothetical protein